MDTLKLISHRYRNLAKLNKFNVVEKIRWHNKSEKTFCMMLEHMGLEKMDETKAVVFFATLRRMEELFEDLNLDKDLPYVWAVSHAEFYVYPFMANKLPSENKVIRKLTNTEHDYTFTYLSVGVMLYISFIMLLY